jgi:hypothetical protein
MQRAFITIIAIAAWLGLLLQFVLTLADPITLDVPIFERIIRFFSFFTILSNLMVALASSAIAFFPNSKLGRFVNSASVLAAIAVYITIVGIVYSAFLRGVVELTGWHVTSDHIIHDIVPPAFVLYWLILAPKAGITWIDPVKWLIFPALYIVYSLIHGALDNWYPYWFADVSKLGYPTALQNSAFVLVAFLIVGLIYAAIAKLASRTANSAST